MKINHKEAIIIILATIIAFLIRFFSAFDNLWMDEVWSLELIRPIHGAWKVFSIHHDNNHILNSIYLFYLGEGAWWPQYRLLSIIAGTALIPVVGWLGFRKGFLNGLIGLILVTFSMPLIIYSSEARGYALAIFFSVLAFAAYQNYEKNNNSRSIIIFWVSSILGILSHLLFLYVFTAFLTASIFRSGYKRAMVRSQLKKILSWHLVPAIFIAIFLFSWVDITIGQGPYIPLGIQRFSLFMAPALGLPKEYFWSVPIGLSIFVLTALWIYRLEKKSDSTWVIYYIIVIIMPLIGFIVPFLFFAVRFLALSLPFFYLILTSIIAAGIKYSRPSRILCFLFLAVFATGNIIMLKNHLVLGRGDYLGAVLYMMDKSKGHVVSIVSDHDFRNSMMINFYSQFVKSDKKIKIFPRALPSWQKNEPEWFIKHESNPKISPPPTIVWFDKKYKLERVFPYSGIASGWSWFLYKCYNCDI